jgi:hypothetical protein
MSSSRPAGGTVPVGGQAPLLNIAKAAGTTRPGG